MFVHIVCIQYFKSIAIESRYMQFQLKEKNLKAQAFTSAQSSGEIKLGSRH